MLRLNSRFTTLWCVTLRDNTPYDILAPLSQAWERLALLGFADGLAAFLCLGFPPNKKTTRQRIKTEGLGVRARGLVPILLTFPGNRWDRSSIN